MRHARMRVEIPAGAEPQADFVGGGAGLKIVSFTFSVSGWLFSLPTESASSDLKLSTRVTLFRFYLREHFFGLGSLLVGISFRFSVAASIRPTSVWSLAR